MVIETVGRTLKARSTVTVEGANGKESEFSTFIQDRNDHDLALPQENL